MKTQAYLLTALTACATAFAQSTVVIPSTGAARTAAGLDANWQVISSSISGETGTGPAAIVGTLPGGWTTPDSGTGWIAPAADQTNATRSGTCCSGAAVYQVQFNVTDPSTAVFQMKIAGDETITMFLNGTKDSNGYYDDSSTVYSTVGPTYNSPVPVTVKQGAIYTDPGGYTHVVKFVTGLNTIVVEVDNFGGGPTGLYINFTQPAIPGPTSYTDAGLANGQVNATPDPIDSGSGQFYDTEPDFQLGGALQLGFSRYYGSQLSKTGFVSALGTNWMGTYDVAALINASKAQVVLFGGRVVTFAKSPGAWVLQSPQDRPYQFIAVSAGYQFLEPATNRVYTFNTSGTLTKVEDRNGNAITVTPGAGGPAKVADGSGRSISFTYSGGQLASIADQSGRTIAYGYSGGLLTSVTDPLKAVTNYTYTTSGNLKGLLTKETLPLGDSPVTQTYDSTGRAIAQADAMGNVTKIAYDGLGGTTIVDAGSGVTLHNNDAAGNLLQLTDALGGTAAATYDADQRRTSITDKTGGLLQYSYDPQSGSIASITDANNNTTSYSYTPQMKNGLTYYDLSGATFPDGTIFSASYDASGNLLSATLPDQSTIGYTYDAQGRVVTATDAAGNATSYAWNADGTLGSKTDAAGNRFQYQYDSLKRRSKIVDPNGNSASFTYDADGRLLTNSSPGWAPWTLQYDVNGQLTSVLNPVGGSYGFSYSPMGLIASSTDPLKNTQSYGYDNLNRLTKIVNGAGEATVYAYDAGNRVVSIADNTGALTQYGYDAEGRFTSATDATGRTTSYTLDPGGRVITVTDPSGSADQYTYDWRGNWLTRTDALGGQYSQSFNALGQLTGLTSPGGLTTTMQRDAAGQLVSLTSANGNAWTLTYDGIERLTSITDPLGNATQLKYKGTLLSEADYPLGSVTFTYSANGVQTKATYSDGTIIHSTPDAMGLIIAADGVSITRNALGLATSVNGMSVTYDGAERLATLTYAPGKTLTYTYDKAGNLSSIADWIGGQTMFLSDSAGRMTSETFPNGVATSYGFDAVGRVNSIQYGTLGSLALTFDATGKTIAADRNLPIAPVLQDDTKQYAYDAAGELASATSDAMGRVTAQGSRTYTWNLASQLTGFADPVNQAAITYDGLGEMSSSTASGVLENYVFNPEVKLPALAIVKAADGTDSRYYVYMPDGELLYAIDAATGARHFYHFDENGNTVFLTDDTGALSDSYGITPYGEVVSHAGTFDNPFTWQGQYGVMQEGDGLYFMRARHYDASAARFLSPDPVIGTQPLQSEPYAYAGGNPLLYHDPLGNWWNPLAPIINWLGSLISPPKPAPAPVRKPAPVAKPVVQPPPALKPKPAAPAPAVKPPQTTTCAALGCVVSKVVSNDGGSVLGDNGAGIISDNSEGIISDNSEGFVQLNANGLAPQVNFYKLDSLATPKPKNSKK